MKLFIVAALFGLSSAGRLDNAYLPPRGNSGSGAFGGNQGFGAAANTFGQKSGGSYNAGFGGQGGFATQNSGNAYNAPAQTYNAPQSYNTRQQSSYEANAQILKLNSDVTADGFSYDFETSNGIRADASGVATNGVQSQGSFGYKGDDGQDYSITYTADENGYRPQGAHLPTPPPIPEAILKSLEQNARDEAAGISDDGTYRGEGAGAGGYSSNRGPSTQYGAPAPNNQYGAPAPSNQYGAPALSNQYGAPAPSNQYGAPNRGFQQPSRSSNFGAATSRQYLTPNAGPARSGNGNFNQQSGYHY